MATHKRKDFFAIGHAFSAYLSKYGRIRELPISYEALLNYQDAFPLIDSNGNDTHWQTLVYEQNYGKALYQGLKKLTHYYVQVGMNSSYITFLSIVLIFAPSATPSPCVFEWLTSSTIIMITFT